MLSTLKQFAIFMPDETDAPFLKLLKPLVKNGEKLVEVPFEKPDQEYPLAGTYETYEAFYDVIKKEELSVIKNNEEILFIDMPRVAVGTITIPAAYELLCVLNRLSGFVEKPGFETISSSLNLQLLSLCFSLLATLHHDNSIMADKLEKLTSTKQPVGKDIRALKSRVAELEKGLTDVEMDLSELKDVLRVDDESEDAFDEDENDGRN